MISRVRSISGLRRPHNRYEGTLNHRYTHGNCLPALKDIREMVWTLKTARLLSFFETREDVRHSYPLLARLTIFSMSWSAITPSSSSLLPANCACDRVCYNNEVKPTSPGYEAICECSLTSIIEFSIRSSFYPYCEYCKNSTLVFAAHRKQPSQSWWRQQFCCAVQRSKSFDDVYLQS
jgi:hypothetical protein